VARLETENKKKGGKEKIKGKKEAKGKKKKKLK